jgi:hypothetical protein
MLKSAYYVLKDSPAHRSDDTHFTKMDRKQLAFLRFWFLKKFVEKKPKIKKASQN